MAALQEEKLDDVGLGLVEIVISMFLIALLAVAFVPVIISGIKASTLNSTTATATRLVSQAVDAARAADPGSCADAQLLNATSTQDDAQGVTLRVTTSVPPIGTCVDNTVMTVTVTVVDVAAPSSPIVDARTQIFLDGS